MKISEFTVSCHNITNTNVIHTEKYVSTTFSSSLLPLISTRTSDGIFLLMLGIQARISPWTITNNIGVDAKRDFSI